MFQYDHKKLLNPKESGIYTNKCSYYFYDPLSLSNNKSNLTVILFHFYGAHDSTLKRQKKEAEGKGENSWYRSNANIDASFFLISRQKINLVFEFMVSSWSKHKKQHLNNCTINISWFIIAYSSLGLWKKQRLSECKRFKI